MLAVFGVLFCYSLQFFGCFFPFNALNFIVLGNMNMTKLLMWSVMGWSAFKEMYLYAIEDPLTLNNTPTGHIWVGFVAAVLENLIEVKWYDKGVVKYTDGIAPWKQVCWLVPLGLYFARYFYLFVNSYKEAKKLKVFKNKQKGE